MILLDLSQTDPGILLKSDEEKEFYLCANCYTKLTRQDDIISIPADKSFHTFTNPGGFTYNIITFSQCEAYREISLPVLHDTWFPGYSWIVINCASCNNLLGWKYIQEGANPACFFGLIREQIVLA